MARQLSGSVSTTVFRDTDTVRIDFTDPLPDAGIMLFIDNADGNTPSLAVQAADEAGFTLKLNNWNPRFAEIDHKISWIAMDPGTHAFGHGCVIETDTPSRNGTRHAGLSAEGDGQEETGPKTALRPLPPVSRLVGETLAEYARRQAADAEQELALDAEFYDALRLTTARETAPATRSTPGTAPQDSDPDAPHPADLPIDMGDDTRLIDDWLVEFVASHEPLEAEAVTYEADAATGSLGGAACYTIGTEITTLKGQIDAAQLAPGDIVLTRDHGFQEVRDVVTASLTRYQLALAPDLAPVCIRADALGPGRPLADMMVAPNHRLLLTGIHADLLSGEEEVFLTAKSLIDGRHVLQTAPEEVTYFVFLFDVPQVIYANGTASEALSTRMLARGDLTPDARDDLARIFPNLPRPIHAVAQAI